MSRYAIQAFGTDKRTVAIVIDNRVDKDADVRLVTDHMGVYVVNDKTKERFPAMCTITLGERFSRDEALAIANAISTALNTEWVKKQLG